MKRYHMGYVQEPENLKRGKAYAFRTHHGYFSSGHDSMTYIPQSVCIVGETNDVGNTLFYIPCWVLAQKGVHPNQLDNFGWQQDVSM